MPPRTHPRHAFLAGLFLLAGPAAAQTSPPVAPPPPPPASMTQPAAPGLGGVDPAVTALFKQTIAAHQALSALSATLSTSSTGAGPASHGLVTLAYRKPGEAKVVISGTGGPVAQFLSNGKTLTFYDVRNKKYQTQPAPPGTDTVPLVLDQVHTLLTRLMGHPEALNALLAQPGVKISLSPNSTYVLAAVDTVVATLPAPDGSKVVFTFDIGKSDHLLRQVTQNATRTNQGKPQAFMSQETVTQLAAATAYTASDFTFTPPPGVTKAAAPRASANPPMHDPRLVPGAKPFPVVAKDLNGRPLTLAQYHGKVVLMDFWATWCGPCVGEMPNVIAAYKKYHAQGFDIVGVSLDQSRPALVRFIAEDKMPWRQIYDGKYWSSAVPREYGVMAIPFGLLVGRDGKIAAVDVRGPALEAAVQQALAK